MKLKSILGSVAIASALVAQAVTPVVKPGVEVLRDGGFEALRGKRVGLITNPTGVDNALRATVDILNDAPDVKLVALFAPEHGVRGDVTAGAKVADTTDPSTGVKVYSLYGATRRPTAAMLRDVDAVVYDIQDNGCRSYTFISTMANAMEACAAQSKEFVVLDRPDPLGGTKVEGNKVDPGCESFVGALPIPYIYGLTPGELARMIVGEKMIKGAEKLKLTVIPMEGWRREMLFADTGMPWVLPSPHMPTPETALYYPATGIVGELDYVSIGVGYTMPFRTFAAPWINAGKLAARLNAMKIPGVRFRPINYKPYYGFGKGVQMGGVELYVTNFEQAPLTLVQFYVTEALADMYPAHKAFAAAPAARQKMFDKVTGSPQVRQLFSRCYRTADLLPLWNRDAASFSKDKAKYHLYK